MSNDVRIKCTVHGPADEVERLRALAFENGKRFDFDRVIPTPAALKKPIKEPRDSLAIICARAGYTPLDHNIFWRLTMERIGVNFESNDRRHLQNTAAAYLALHPEVERAGRLAFDVATATGYVDRDSWRIAHWGTPYPSSNLRVLSQDPFQFRVDSYHQFPRRIFEKLAELFPSLSFDCACHERRDEFSGEGWFNPPPGMPAFALCDCDPRIYERVHGTKYVSYHGEPWIGAPATTLPIQQTRKSN